MSFPSISTMLPKCSERHYFILGIFRPALASRDASAYEACGACSGIPCKSLERSVFSSPGCRASVDKAVHVPAIAI